MSWNKLTIEKNALASLVLTLVMIGIVVWMNYAGVERIEINSDRLARANAILNVLQELREHIAVVETGERGYIITGNDDFLEPYKHGLGMVALQRGELVRLLADEPSEQGRLDELNKRLDTKIAFAQANIEARRQGFEAAQARVVSGTGKREMDALVLVLDDMSAAQADLKNGLNNQRINEIDLMEEYVTIATLVTISILIYLHLRILRLSKQRQEDEQQLQHMASHDTLTGLPNRRLMLEHIDQAMQRCKRHNKSLALLFLDLNGFKPVNDQYGHEAGDEVLRQVAHRLSAAMRASDRVARLGGDEFVVLIEDVSDKEDVCGIIGKVDLEISRSILLKEDVAVNISTSIGVAIYPGNGDDMEALLHKADTAMYEAKKSESNCFCKELSQQRRCELKSTERNNEVSYLPL